jgi:hypothetical protein
VKYIVGFGTFWYDFIVGDSILLAVGGVGGLTFAYLVVLMGAAAAAGIVLPLVVILFLGLSLIRT